MAMTNPLDEILNSTVDQSAINAVYDGLQNQLASPTLRAQINANLTTTDGIIHSGTSIISGSQSHTNTHCTPTNAFSVNNQQISGSNLNGGRNMIGGVPPNHMSSTVTTVNPHGFVKTENTYQNAIINNSQLHPVQNIGIVKGESVHQPNIITSRINPIQNAIPSGTSVSQTLGGVSNSGSAIFNLANVASEQKPIMISNTSDMKQTFPNAVDSKQVLVVNSNSMQRPQYVIKQEARPQIKTEIKQEYPQMMQPGQIRVMANPAHQVTSSFNAIHNQNMLRTPLTASSTSVVMTKPVATPQTVTVVRPAISTAFSHSPNVMNSPRLATNASPRTTLQRPIGSAPIRIAPQNQPLVRSQGGGTIALPPGLQLPPGAVLMKNAEGQLVMVQGAQPGAQKVQHVRPGVQSAIPASAPGISTQRPSPHIAPPVSRPQMSLANQPQLAQPQPAPNAVVQPTQPSQAQIKETVFDSMKKCKNFLQTLIKLASQSNQSSNTVDSVKKLIQQLIDAKVEPEVFTEKLQAILNSSPQPYLVPFLKKSLPMLRLYLIQNKTKIDGVQAPPAEVMLKHPVPMLQSLPATAAHPAVSHTTATPVQNKPQIPPNIKSMTPQQVQQFVQQAKLQQQQKAAAQAAHTKALLTKQPASSRAGLPNMANTPNRAGTSMAGRAATPNMAGNASRAGVAGRTPGRAPSTIGALASSTPTPSKDSQKRKFDSSAIKDDDDINDVATMGGVNLSEESRNIMASTELLSGQMRSCKDESFLASQPLAAKINRIARKHGLEDCPPEVVNLISHATQERVKNLLERLSVIAEHRLEIYKNDARFERASEPRGQLKFLEELDQLEKKRHSEAEREVLLRAAKSRSKNEDPEHLKLREKAKQMQQMELEAARQKEANLTALAAIGPRKKRKIEDPASTSEGLSSSSSLSNMGTLRQRIKRVNLRDLMFLLEQERESNKSTLMFKTFLK